LIDILDIFNSLRVLEVKYFGYRNYLRLQRKEGWIS